jgi:hypothetical protein
VELEGNKIDGLREMQQLFGVTFGFSTIGKTIQLKIK